MINAEDLQSETCDKEALEKEKLKFEKDKQMLDNAMRDNSFIVFDNVKGQVIKEATRYEDGKWHFILTIICSLVALEKVFLSRATWGK